MRCVVCNSDDISMTDVKEELNIHNDIVYVPIRTLACRACGERYYNRRTVRFLEEVEKELADGKGTLQEVGKVLVYEH